jgi:hypothetical protein
MTDRRLDRLLWRCEFGSVAPEVLALELRERLQRLRDESIDVRDSATVRLWDDALISEYDAAFHGAARTLDLRLWRSAMQQIHRCERVVASMRTVVQASGDAERATTAMKQIHDLAETACLRRLPAVASLAQIVDLAKQSILERHSAQGSHIARICVRLTRALQERRPIATDERIGLQERIAAVRELCVATCSFVEAVDDEPTHDGTLTTLQSLFASQYAALGTRLLSELEVKLAGRRRFLRYVQRKRLGGSAALGGLDEVRALVRERSWDGAVDHYWHLSIARHAGALAEQGRRVAAAAAEIRNAITPQEASDE